MSISLPRLVGAVAEPRRLMEGDKYDLIAKVDQLRLEERAVYLKKTARSSDEHSTCGETIYGDYLVSDAELPGAVGQLAIGPPGAS